MAIQFSQN